MNTTFNLAKILPLLIPVLLIQVGLQIYALIDLYRQTQVKGNKWLWVVIIILGEIVGPIVYFLFARKEE
jgi:4-amino-4-deoxy-L-arabinose transferase-like glycosyltransferase